MKLQIAALADCANVALGGKLNLMGVFDVIYAREFPVIHPAMTLAMRLRFESEDEGEHKLVVLVVDPDGKQIARAETTIRTPRIEPGLTVSSNHMISFQHVQIPGEGKIIFEIYWDGIQQERVPLFIRTLPPSLPNANE